jgi:hypothetical protein
VSGTSPAILLFGGTEKILRYPPFLGIVRRIDASCRCNFHPARPGIAWRGFNAPSCDTRIKVADELAGNPIRAPWLRHGAPVSPSVPTNSSVQDLLRPPIPNRTNGQAPMAKQKTDLVIVGFNYERLKPEAAATARAAADHIRSKVKKAIVDIIEIGKELVAVKDAVAHGHFGPWLKAEFGWTERTAQNFMSVAERFGAKSEIIADLKIQPTAAYILASPSVPDEARNKALQRAEAGEQITAAVAKKILAETRKKRRTKLKANESSDKIAEHLDRRLTLFRERWNPKDLASLAKKLRDFADELEKDRKSGRRA